ncbi:MAG: ABC transporter permease [Planctomycetota bacterium]|nr:ABC transporter permease [Planctomycetota bacterium]
MTTAGNIPVSPSSAEGDASFLTAKTPSYWTQVVRDTLSRGGARAGSAWILVLILTAVFAPFLASSWPYLLEMDGKWSSPLLKHLTPQDVDLLVLAGSVVTAAFFCRVSIAKRAIWVGSIQIVTILSSYVLIHPPLTNDWQYYRDLDRSGKLQYKIMAPVPFSANDYQRDLSDTMLKAPSHLHLLGTEANGGDVLSRMIHACRIALAIGVISTGLSIAIGIAVGGLMGYFGGNVDMLGMRLIEIFEAIPTLFLLIIFIAFFGRNLYYMMAIIGLTSWTGDARYIRAEFLRLREQDFVQAAVAGGLPLRSIIFRHLLPNGISPILVTASFGIASAILFESILSFLGIGLIEEPSWGQMLNQSLGVGGDFIWWIAFYPGLAIFLTVFSYNLLGESLRDAMDPKLRR